MGFHSFVFLTDKITHTKKLVSKQTPFYDQCHKNLLILLFKFIGGVTDRYSFYIHVMEEESRKVVKAREWEGQH